MVKKKKLISLVCALAMLASATFVPTMLHAQTTGSVMLDIDFDDGVSPSEKEYRMNLNDVQSVQTDADGRKYMRLVNGDLNWDNFGWELDTPLTSGTDKIGTTYHISFDFRADDINRTSSYGGQAVHLFNNSNWNEKVWVLLGIGDSPYAFTSNSAVGFYFDDNLLNITPKADTWYSYDLTTQVQSHDNGNDTKYAHTLVITEINDPTNTVTYTSTRYNQGNAASGYENRMRWLSRHTEYNYFGKALGEQIDIDNICITSGDPYPYITNVSYYDADATLQSKPDAQTRTAKITYSEAMQNTNLVALGEVTLIDSLGTEWPITNGGWSNGGKTYTVNIPALNGADKYKFNVSRNIYSADDSQKTRKAYDFSFVTTNVINPVSVTGVKYLLEDGIVTDVFTTDVKAVEIGFAGRMDTSTLSSGITFTGSNMSFGEGVYKATSADGLRTEVYEIPVYNIVPGSTCTISVGTSVKTILGGILDTAFSHVTAPAKNANVLFDQDFNNGVSINEVRMTLNSSGCYVPITEGNRTFMRLQRANRGWDLIGWKFDVPMTTGVADIGKTYNIEFDFRLLSVSLQSPLLSTTAAASGYTAHRLNLSRQGKDWQSDGFNLVVAGTDPWSYTATGQTGFWFDDTKLNIEAKDNTWYSYKLSTTISAYGQDVKYNHVLTITEIANPQNSVTYVSPDRYSGTWKIKDLTNGGYFDQITSSFGAQIDVDDITVTVGDPFVKVTNIEYIDSQDQEFGDEIDSSLSKIKITFDKEMKNLNLAGNGIVTLKTADGLSSVALTNGGWSQDKKTYTAIVDSDSIEGDTEYKLSVARGAIAEDSNKLQKPYSTSFTTVESLVSVEAVTYENISGKELQFFDDTAKKIKILFSRAVSSDSIIDGDITLVDELESAVSFTGQLLSDNKTYEITLDNYPELDKVYTLSVSGVESLTGVGMEAPYVIEILCETGRDVLRVNYDNHTKDAYYFKAESTVATEEMVTIMEAAETEPVLGNYAQISANANGWINVGYQFDPLDIDKTYKLRMKFSSVSGSGYYGLALTNQSGASLNSAWSDSVTAGVITPVASGDTLLMKAGKSSNISVYGGNIQNFERNHWYELEAVFSGGAMTAKITDLSDSSKYAIARAGFNYDGFDKLVLRAGHVMKVDDIYFEETSPSSILFEADFNEYDPGIEMFNEQINQGKTIKSGAPDGTNYLNYSPSSYLSNGWSFTTPMKTDGTYYDVSFDFRLNTNILTSETAYPLMLSEKPINDDNCYRGFGLLKVGADNRFYIGGRALKGITWDSSKWYSYDLTFNPLSKYVNVVITQKSAPFETAEFNGFLVSGEYGYHQGDNMPSLDFDCIKFTYNPNIDIDNMLVRTSTKKPVGVNVTSAHVGNIFGQNDTKSLDITLTNSLDEEISATVDYIIYDNNDNVIKTGTLPGTQFLESEQKTVTINAGINLLYGLYEIKFDITAENETLDVNYESDVFKFSVANKVNYLNHDVAVNIERISSMEEWEEYKEVITQSGMSGVRFDLSWGDVSDGTETGFKNPQDVDSTVWFEDAYESGIDILAILNTYSPVSQKRPDELVTTSLADIKASSTFLNWKEYIKHATNTYGQYIHGFEIQNEPTWWTTGWISSNGARFVDTYLKPANDIIKSTGISTKVYGISSASIWYYWLDAALAQMKNNGGADSYMDVMAIHPYDFASSGWNDSHFNFPVEIYPDGTELADTMNAADTTSHAVMLRDRIWHAKMNELNTHLVNYNAFSNITKEATEIGITATEGSASPRTQAADLVQLFATNKAISYYDRLWYFNLENYQNMGSEEEIPAPDEFGSSQFTTEGGWGLLCNYRDTVPLAAKESYIALCGYNAMMEGATYKSSWQYVSYLNNPSSQSHTSFYGFENRAKDGKDVFILWTEPANKHMTTTENFAVDLGAQYADVYDMYSNYIGRVYAQTNSNGASVFSFASGMEPVYIVGDFTKCATNDNNVYMTGRTYGFPGETVSISINNRLNKNLRVEIDSKSANLLVNAPDTIAYGTSTITATILPGASKEEEILVNLYDGNNLVYTSKSYVLVKKAKLEWVEDMSTASPTPIHTFDEITASGNDRVRVTVENLGGQTLNSKIVITYYDDEDTVLSTRTVDATFTKRGDREPVNLNIGMVEGATKLVITHCDTTQAMNQLCEPLYFTKP